MSKASIAAVTAHSIHKTGCRTCLELCDIEQHHCYVCGSRITHTSSRSLQLCAAWLITSALLYIPSNIYPIMYTTYLGETIESTILGGVVTLWEQGSYPIALVIFIASVLVPVIKILALSWLCFSVLTQRIYFFKTNHQMFRFTEFIGRWSMVDVFVVAVLVAMIQMGNLMKVMPGEATIAFAAMVVTTMLAAHYFDPRLIWINQRGNSSDD